MCCRKAIISDILSSTEHIGTDNRYALFFLPAKSGFTVLLRTISPRTEMRGLLLHINVIYREQKLLSLLSNYYSTGCEKCNACNCCNAFNTCVCVGLCRIACCGSCCVSRSCCISGFNVSTRDSVDT